MQPTHLPDSLLGQQKNNLNNKITTKQTLKKYICSACIIDIISIYFLQLCIVIDLEMKENKSISVQYIFLLHHLTPIPVPIIQKKIKGELRQVS